MDITWGVSANETAWGGLIAFYLFLAGIAAGAFLAAALTDLFGKNKYPGVIKAGATIPPVAIIVGLLLLIFDLGRPLHFWKLLLNVNFSSVMSLGTFIISIFTGLAVIYAYVIWTSSSAHTLRTQITSADQEIAAATDARFQVLRKPVAAVGALFALGTATYTGFLLSAVSTNEFWSLSFPGIRFLPFLPFLFLVSALSTGLTATMVGSIRSKDLTVYKKIDIVLIALEILLLIVLYTSVKAVYFTGNMSVLFWFGVVVIGLLIPLGLSIYGVSKHKNVILPAGSMIIVGGLALRYFIVYAGQRF